MHRPMTLVAVLSVLAGILAFVGTLVGAPGPRVVRPGSGDVGSEGVEFGSQVRRLASEYKWARVSAAARAALRQSPGHLEALLFLGIGEERSGDPGGADEAWQRLLDVTEQLTAREGENASIWYYRGWALHGLGDDEAALEAWREHLERAGETSRYNRACYLALAGEREGALEALESITDGPPGTLLEAFDEAWARVDPDLDSIRDDPRFERAIRQAGERQRYRLQGDVPV